MQSSQVSLPSWLLVRMTPCPPKLELQMMGKIRWSPLVDISIPQENPRSIKNQTAFLLVQFSNPFSSVPKGPLRSTHKWKHWIKCCSKCDLQKNQDLCIWACAVSAVCWSGLLWTKPNLPWFHLFNIERWDNKLSKVSIRVSSACLM